MSRHLEINQADYKVSNIRIINMITQEIQGTISVRVDMYDNSSYNFITHVRENMLREILITLDYIHNGIKSMQIKSSDTFIELECSGGKIETNISKERFPELEKRLNLLKYSTDLQSAYITVLNYDELLITEVLDLLSKYGKLMNANTIHLNKVEKLHIAKYRYFSLMISRNKVYIVDFGVDDHVKAKKVIETIRNDFDKRTGLKSRLEEFCIR